MTAWGSQRTYGNFVPAYTCSKNRDFEGLLAHELGHAMGLPHPGSVDTHDPALSPNAATVASCSNNLDYATMCGPRTYRTTAQTLHAWDRESFRIIEVQH
jgi:hypothetical protein